MSIYLIAGMILGSTVMGLAITLSIGASLLKQYSFVNQEEIGQRDMEIPKRKVSPTLGELIKNKALLQFREEISKISIKPVKKYYLFIMLGIFLLLMCVSVDTINQPQNTVITFSKSLDDTRQKEQWLFTQTGIDIVVHDPQYRVGVLGTLVLSLIGIMVTAIALTRQIDKVV